MTIAEVIFLIVLVILVILLLLKDQKTYICLYCGRASKLSNGGGAIRYYCPECKRETKQVRQ